MDLLTFEEYEQRDHPRPYRYEIRSAEKLLSYFGETHSHDPSDAQWESLKEAWAIFTRDAGASRQAFIEGGLMRLPASEEEAIADHGGMGLVRWLGDRDGVPVSSPEPTYEQEVATLLERFPAPLIQYYYFARTLLQWNRLATPRPDVRSYVEPYLERPIDVARWRGQELGFARMLEVHREQGNATFDPEDRELWYRLADPVALATEASQVSRASNVFRDEHVVAAIARAWEAGGSVFAIFGATHAQMQEPALRNLIQ